MWTLSLYSRVLFKLLETVLERSIKPIVDFNIILRILSVRGEIKRTWPSMDRLRTCNFYKRYPVALQVWSWEWETPRAIDIAPAMDENTFPCLCRPYMRGPSVDDISLAPHVHDFPFRACDQLKFHVSNNGRFAMTVKNALSRQMSAHDYQWFEAVECWSFTRVEKWHDFGCRRWILRFSILYR